MSSWDDLFDGLGGGPPLGVGVPRSRDVGVPCSIITNGDEGDRPGLAVGVADGVALRRPETGGVARLYASGNAPLWDAEGDRDVG